MLAFRKTRSAFGAELTDAPHASGPGPEEAVVRIAAAGICGSDLHAFEWTSGYEFMADRLPLTLGHEFCGTVTHIGSCVTGIAVGDHVTCWPTITCGTCPGCVSGHPELCERRRIVGLHVDGGFAGQVTLPAATLRRLPTALPMSRAALTEPMAVAVNAVNLAEVARGDRVAILGPGPIGMLAAWTASHRGAEVLLVGKADAARLDIARSLGIPHVADLDDAPLDAAVTAAFGGRIDRVIEATGSASSVEEGLEVLRPGGILVAAGIHARPCTLDLTRLVREKKQVRGAHDTTEAAFAEAMALLAEHCADLDRVITHRLPLDRAEEAMALAQSRAAVKVLLIPATEILT